MYEWIEYSVTKDAVFCFPCRQFALRAVSSDQLFTTSGFKNWKKALEKGKGLVQHDQSQTHTKSMADWIDRQKRDANDKSCSNLVSGTILAYRRKYLNGIIDVIIFLVENELSLRGSYDIDSHTEDGLFNNLFQYTLKNNVELQKCQQYMPKNALYTSPIIQNEIIAILAKLVREQIVNEIKSADVSFFTILVDGTKDKKGNECISLCARYVINGKPTESVLFFESSERLDAASLTELILKSLNSYGLCADNIISQCYDGAFVMSGEKSGVQTRLQSMLQKKIPYVHCMNHRLHLVVIDMIKSVELIQYFFDQLRLIYDFFRRHKVRRLYEGTAAVRLIDTRWTGHLDASHNVFQNYAQIIETLDKIIRRDCEVKFDGDDIVLADGIHRAISKPEFVFMLIFMNDILGLIAPADKILQKREFGYREAQPVIHATVIKIRELRCDEKYETIKNKMNEMIGENPTAELIERRNRKRPSRFNDPVVYEKLGERGDAEVEIRAAFFEVIDVTVKELEYRFKDNDEVLLAISDSHKMDRAKLLPLAELKIMLPSENELTVAKTFIDRENQKQIENASASGEKLMPIRIRELLYEYRSAFPDTYDLFAAVDTFGCSTAICESSFSALSRINVVTRISMTDERMRNLAYLAFEAKRLKRISNEDVLKIFNESKQRKVQLY